MWQQITVGVNKCKTWCFSDTSVWNEMSLNLLLGNWEDFMLILKSFSAPSLVRVKVQIKMWWIFFPPPPSLSFRIQWRSSESSVGCQQCPTSCSVFLLWAPGCQRLTGPLYYSLTCRITTPPWRHRGRYQMSYDVSSQPTKLWEKHWADCHYVVMHFPRDLHLWEIRDASAEMDAEMDPKNKDLNGVADLHTMTSYVFLPQLAVLPSGPGWTAAGHHEWFH